MEVSIITYKNIIILQQFALPLTFFDLKSVKLELE